jgi:exodeoxyribonuclease V alpha subunit
MAESLAQNKALTPYLANTSTLHKLLGYNPSSGECYYNQKRKLKVDLLAIDESSMLDYYLFLALIQALPSTARLILLGDANQLPSVGVGAILDQLLRAKKLHHNVVKLQKCYRSNQQILNLAWAILTDDKAKIQHYLTDECSNKIISYIEITNLNYKNFIASQAECYKNLFTKLTVEELYQSLHKYIIITPLKGEGLYGSAGLNRAITLAINSQPLYHGLPLIITANLPNLQLNNGERGLVVNQNGLFCGYFAGRFIPMALIKEWQVAYCITVHKSQGSEFEAVTLVVPEGSQRILDNKLFYTALTRAKNSVTLVAPLDTMTSIKASRPRNSNLHKAL